MFVALGVALGFVLNRIPNVELVTSTVFLSGYLLGIGKGLAVGVITEVVYSVLNPYGMAALPLLAAQVVSMGVTGLAGGWFGAKRSGERGFLAVKCGLVGFSCTLFFDALTTLSFVPINHFSAKQLAASILIGGWFYAAHLVSNSAIFAVLLPALIRTLQRQFPR